VGLRRARSLRGLLSSRPALIVWSLLLCFAVGECGLRALGRAKGVDYRLYAEDLVAAFQWPPGLSCQLPGYPYRSLCPNFEGVFARVDYAFLVETNSRGLRDAEVPLAKPPGRTRILALGDSFTFGTGVEYGGRYTDILERGVEGLDVITMAVPGSGHDQQLMQFVHEGLAYQPDHVFVFVTAATLDPMRTFPPLLRDGRVELPDFERFVPRGRFPSAEERIARAASRWPLWRKSYAASLLAFGLQRAVLRLRYRPADDSLWQAALRLPAQWAGSEAPLALAASQVERAERVFRELVAIASAHGIAATFVDLDSRYAHDYLERLGPGVRVLDLSAALREEAKRRPLGFAHDAHFNPQTHALIGARLVEFVRGGFAAPGAGAAEAGSRGAPAANSSPPESPLEQTGPVAPERHASEFGRPAARTRRAHPPRQEQALAVPARAQRGQLRHERDALRRRPARARHRQPLRQRLRRGPRDRVPLNLPQAGSWLPSTQQAWKPTGTRCGSATTARGAASKSRASSTWASEGPPPASCTKQTT
jgi:hypothetical protein